MRIRVESLTQERLYATDKEFAYQNRHCASLMSAGGEGLWMPEHVTTRESFRVDASVCRTNSSRTKPLGLFLYGQNL
jgi:hypothetical protein